MKVRFKGMPKYRTLHLYLRQYTGNHKKLVVGEEYEIISIEMYPEHTAYFLKGHKGSFNSVFFEQVDGPWTALEYQNIRKIYSY